jgi:putative oxidoreductase
MDHYRDLGLLILRLGFGLSFFWHHGYPKLAGGPQMWERIGDAVSNVGIDFAHAAWGLAAALSEGVGGLLFAAGLFFRPVCVAMFGVMVFATIEQFGREMPQPEHALKNAFVLAGLFFVGPGRYTVGSLVRGSRKIAIVAKPDGRKPETTK